MLRQGLGRHEMEQQLTDAIKKAAKVQLSPADMLEQRASFIFGSIRARDGITKDSIKQQIIRSQGGATESPRDTY